MQGGIISGRQEDIMANSRVSIASSVVSGYTEHMDGGELPDLSVDRSVFSSSQEESLSQVAVSLPHVCACSFPFLVMQVDSKQSDGVDLPGLSRARLDVGESQVQSFPKTHVASTLPSSAS